MILRVFRYDNKASANSNLSAKIEYDCQVLEYSFKSDGEFSWVMMWKKKTSQKLRNIEQKCYKYATFIFLLFEPSMNLHLSI